MAGRPGPPLGRPRDRGGGGPPAGREPPAPREGPCPDSYYAHVLSLFVSPYMHSLIDRTNHLRHGRFLIPSFMLTRTPVRSPSPPTTCSGSSPAMPAREEPHPADPSAPHGERPLHCTPPCPVQVPSPLPRWAVRAPESQRGRGRGRGWDRPCRPSGPRAVRVRVRVGVGVAARGGVGAVWRRLAGR